MSFQDFATSSLDGRALTRDQCHAVLACPEEDLLALIDAAYRVRRRYFGNRVHIQVLSNAKSGICPEDCRYCSQSRISTADIPRYPLISEDELLDQAHHARSLGAKRFCMALSGRRPSPSELDRLCAMVRTLKNKTGLSLCGSLGFLERKEADRLKEAGLDRINHNLNTSERFHGQICTTHTYQDRLKTIAACRAAGLEVCSGGIVGQGETDDDIIDLFLALREIGPEAVPVNFLIPVPGTPLADYEGGLDPRRCLRVLCLARFLNPKSEIRAAGGREIHLRSLQPLALYVVDSFFVAGYLTTGGQSPEEAFKMISDLGFEMILEGGEAPLAAASSANEAGA